MESQRNSETSPIENAIGDDLNYGLAKQMEVNELSGSPTEGAAHKSGLDESNLTDVCSSCIHDEKHINSKQFAHHMTAAVLKKASESSEGSKARLDELVRHQEVLLESLEHENERFAASHCFQQMQQMMGKCSTYHSKLIAIKKSMTDITNRTSRLKNRCLKLQELKSKAEVESEEARQKELDRERRLVAQPVISTEQVQPD